MFASYAAIALTAFNPASPVLVMLPAPYVKAATIAAAWRMLGFLALLRLRGLKRWLADLNGLDEPV